MFDLPQFGIVVILIPQPREKDPALKGYTD
jgi:hypothetical protein